MIEICLFIYLKIGNFVAEKEVYLDKEYASIEGEKSLEREVCLRKECGREKKSPERGMSKERNVVSREGEKSLLKGRCV
jgi:hypothetical protein